MVRHETQGLVAFASSECLLNKRLDRPKRHAFELE